MDARGNIFYGAPVVRYCDILKRNCPIHMGYDERDTVEENKELEVFSCGGESDSFEAIGIKVTDISFDWENFHKLDPRNMVSTTNIAFMPGASNGATWFDEIEEAVNKLNSKRQYDEQIKLGEFGWYVGCRLCP